MPSTLDRAGLGFLVDDAYDLLDPFLLSTPDVSDGESTGGEESRYAQELGDSVLSLAGSGVVSGRSSSCQCDSDADDVSPASTCMPAWILD